MHIVAESKSIQKGCGTVFLQCIYNDRTILTALGNTLNTWCRLEYIILAGRDLSVNS